MTGVMVLSPEIHRSILREVYDSGVESEASVYENMPLSYALISRDTVHFIDEGFNIVYPYKIFAHYPHWVMKGAPIRERILAANAIWSRSWFLHFTNGPFRHDVNLVFKDKKSIDTVDAAWARVRALGAEGDKPW